MSIYVIKQFRKNDIDFWCSGGSNAGYFHNFEDAKIRVENNSLPSKIKLRGDLIEHKRENTRVLFKQFRKYNV